MVIRDKVRSGQNVGQQVAQQPEDEFAFGYCRVGSEIAVCAAECDDDGAFGGRIQSKPFGACDALSSFTFHNPASETTAPARR